MSTVSPFPKDDDVTARGGTLRPAWWRWLNELLTQANQHDARIAALEAETTVSALTFPDVHVPSADAHTLDDYEEGSWTPLLRFGGSAVGMAYSVQAGSYVKVGRVVHVTGRIDLSAKSSSTGSATIEGLPFAAADATASFNGAVIAGDMSGLTSPITPRVVANAAVVDLFDWGAAGVVAIDDANFTHTSVVVCTLTYLAGD